MARFFSQEPDGNAYRIQKGIRDRVIFSERDVIKDPPFSKLDLRSCRNLYGEPAKSCVFSADGGPVAIRTPDLYRVKVALFL